MATFKFGRYIDIHWNGYDIQGPADTVFSIPDQLYEEFDADIAPVEPTLQWIDTNEFLTLSNSVSAATLSATFPIALSTSTSGKTISFSSSTNPNGYLLAADGSGGVIFTPASTSGLTSVVGVSPISTAVSGGTVSVSLDASYQTAGTYVTSVIGTSPVSASGTTAITVSIDQTTLSVADASTAATLRTYVKNSSGSTITKGQVVYITGADGTNALIGLASNTSDAASSKTLGIAANTMTNNAFGYVIENGQLSNIDTSAATAGSAVWLGSTPGSYQFTVPDEPNHAVYLGVVTKANVSTGEILVKVQNGYELDELHDVSAGSPSNLDILQYKSSSSLWTKASIANAGIAASVHTHDYQVSGNYQTAGTYVNAVIGTSPASVSTASGTATVSISSGTATSGSVLTANGSGGVSFTAVSSTPEIYYASAYGSVNLSTATAIPSGRYLYQHSGRTARIDVNGTSSTVSDGNISLVNSSSTTVSMPIGWSWNTISTGYTSTDIANNVFYKNSEFYITMNNGKISRSINGSSFTVSSALITTGALNWVAYGNSTYVAVGDGGSVISSSNGTSWTVRTSGSTAILQAVDYRGTTFLAVGSGGAAITSTDGTTWTTRTSGTTNALVVMAASSSTFVVCGTTIIRTTTDGVTWTSRTNPSTANIRDIKFGNNVFAFITENGEIGRSTDDGATWTEVQTLTSSGGDVWQSIEYLGSSMWIAHKTNGVLWYSFDNALTWSAISTINNTIYGTAAVDTGRFAIGNNKLILINVKDANDPESMVSTNQELINFLLFLTKEVTL